jgi:hypothetical protein
VNQFQGQRLDLIAGHGAGQTRLVVHNSATTLTVETAQDLSAIPDTTTAYAIRPAENPVVQVGTVTAATPATLTDSMLALVPNAQQGLTLLLMASGERRLILAHDTTTYQVSPWDGPVPVGSAYAVLAPHLAVGRTCKIVGDAVLIPRAAAFPSGPGRTIRLGLEDLATFTGARLTQEELLYGRDLLLVDGALQWDAYRHDLATVSGMLNVRQAILNKLNMGLGELEEHPLVGSYVREELGLMATALNQLQLAHSVERTIREDTRIARLLDLRLSTVGGQAQVLFNALTITGDTVDRIIVR